MNLIRRIFKSKLKKKVEDLEWQIDCIKGTLAGHDDRLVLLNKLGLQRDYKTLCYVVRLCSSELPDTVMEKKRDEVRKEGYSFCHRMKGGQEVWAKY